MQDGRECFYSRMGVVSRRTVAANNVADATDEVGSFEKTATVNVDAALVKSVGPLLYLHHGPVNR